MLNSAKNRICLDRMAIGLSALCAVHCVATVLLLGALSSLGHFFAAPIVHEIGLALAIVVSISLLFALFVWWVWRKLFRRAPKPQPG